MKLIRITALLALVALMVGCHNEDLRASKEEQSETAGYLSLKNLSVECVVDHKPVDEEVAEKKMASTTRNTPNIDAFECVITDATGANVITSFTYANRPNEITLEAGNYIFKMQSGEMAAAAWEKPVYGLVEPFTIIRKQTTNLTGLVCTLQNIQVSISYSADLRAALSDDTVANVSIEEGKTLTYAIDESRSGFFRAPNSLNDINVVVVGKYTPEGKTEAQPIEMTATIKNVKAGQHSDIYFFIEYSGDGNINVGAEIDGWVVDEEIIFDFSVLLSENVLVDDEHKPTISMPNHDINTPLSLYASDFDDRGNCLKEVIVDFACAEGNTIASLLVEMSSTNAEFIASLEEFNIPQSFDLCNAGAATSIMKLMGYPVNGDVLGQAAISVELTAQMKLLKEFGGTHSFKVTVCDNKGSKSEATLQIVIEGGQSGPTIIWSGHDFNTRYPITDDLTVDLKVVAPAGIKSFLVTIDSEVLTPSQLRGVGLCDVLDLCNPEASYDSTNPDNTNTSEVLAALTGFGFMPEDGSGSWTNATVSNLSITQFLGLLKITGEGLHDFILEVTDNDGNSVKKTLMLVTE